MARPIKTGLDYFSMDVHLDNKFQLIEAVHGIVGFAVVVKLYQKIYGEAGYYCEWGPEISILFARSCGVEYEKVSAILTDALRWKLFSEDMLDNYSILTSAGIQKRYLEATARRKQVDMNGSYLLLDVQSLPVNVCINGVNVDNNSKNAYRSTQSKVKESKVKKIKEDKKKVVVVNATAAAPDFNTIEVYASSNLDYLSPTNMQDLIAFRETLTDDLIRYAIDAACANGVRKWAYVRSILARYQAAGFKTIGEVKADEEKRSQQKAQQKSFGGKQNPALNYEQRSETNYGSTVIDLLGEYGGE